MDIIPHAAGVYKITCVPTGKIYIGSSYDLALRIREHRARLTRGAHVNQYLQRAWDKYGADAFTFEVIELVLEPVRLEREQYWLDKLRPYRGWGFNISRKAGAPMAGLKHSPETVEKLRQNSTGRRHTDEFRRMMSVRNKGKRFVRGGFVPAAPPYTPLSPTDRLIRAHQTQMDTHSSPRSRVTRTYRIACPDGSEVIVKNLAKFSRDHGISETCLRATLTDHIRIHKGYRVIERVDE